MKEVRLLLKMEYLEETLLKQKVFYGELYQLSKEYEDDERVLEIWKERSGKP